MRDIGQGYVVLLGIGIALTLLMVLMWSGGDPEPKSIVLNCGEGNPGVIVHPSSPHYDTVYKMAGGDGRREVSSRVCALIRDLEPDEPEEGLPTW